MNKATYPKKIQRLLDRVLFGTGHTSSQQRQTAANDAFAAEMAIAAQVDRSDPLATYLQKVALYAYRITDKDIERLKAAGHTEDEIFELTVSAAVGAATKRLDRGLAALAPTVNLSK